MIELRDELRATAMRVGNTAQLLAVRIEVPASEGAALCIFEAAPRGAHRFYWDQPTQRHAIAAVGALEIVEDAGVDRFESAAARLRSIATQVCVASLESSNVGAGATRAMWVGGFGFENDAIESEEWDGFAPSSFVLPEAIFEREGERAWLTVVVRRAEAETSAALVDRALAGLEVFAESLLADASSRALERAPACATAYTARPDRPHAVYLGAVATAAEAIARGDLEKVVMGRSLEVEADTAYDAPSVLASLRRAHASTTIFAVGRGERVFLGASPERLVAVAGERLQAAAVAGSAPRGRSPEEDERLGRSLRESKKEQEEHAVVVREIEAALEPLCDEVEHPEAPGLLKLEGIQHLETPFDAHLREGQTGRPHLLELAGRLHPTPAVGGTPREAARDWIRGREALIRGWYAGGVGFVTVEGGGELHVGLRSGLLCGGRARLYAGAGIVGASIPESELVETRLKLRTLLSQLTEI